MNTYERRIDPIPATEESRAVGSRLGGVKGTGMIGTVGTAAAITNAVFHATGVRIRDLPIRLEQLIGERG